MRIHIEQTRPLKINTSMGGKDKRGKTRNGVNKPLFNEEWQSDVACYGRISFLQMDACGVGRSDSENEGRRGRYSGYLCILESP